jgi:hypothetical protein
VRIKIVGKSDGFSLTGMQVKGELVKKDAVCYFMLMNPATTLDFICSWSSMPLHDQFIVNGCGDKQLTDNLT